MRMLVGTTLLLLVFSGCSRQAMSPVSDHEAAIVLMFEQGWNEGRLEAFSATVADSVLFHYAGMPRTLSRDEMNSFVLQWREAFPDLEMRIDELIVKGDIAAARLTFTGTHEGNWQGAAPTGRKVRMALMMFFRFEDGMLVELWESDDQLGLRRQLGLISGSQ